MIWIDYQKFYFNSNEFQIETIKINRKRIQHRNNKSLSNQALESPNQHNMNMCTFDASSSRKFDLESTFSTQVSPFSSIIRSDIDIIH